MNKENFLKEIVKQANITKQEAILVNNILDTNFFISKKNKDKIISELVIKLDISLDKAIEIYNISKKIINNIYKQIYL